MSLVSNAITAQSLRLLNLSPVTGQNVSVQLPQQLTSGISPPSFQATIESLFEARFKRSLNEVTLSAGRVGSAANALSPSGSAFMERSTTTTDPAVADLSATADSGLGSVEIDVKKLATNQVNTGRELSRASTDEFESGRQFFDLTLQKRTERLSIFVAPSDTNKATLDKMAETINDADMNVEASVTVNADSDTARLTIQANETGDESSFTLEDTLGTLVETSGADTVEQASQSAEFHLNGVSHSNETNAFEIDEGRIQVSLNGKTGATTVTATYDSRAVTEAVHEFVIKANQMRQSLAKASKTLNPEIIDTFDRQLSLMRESLTEIGVNVNIGVVLSDLGNTEDALRVDNDALEKAIEGKPTRVQELLAGPGSLTSRIGSIAEAIESSSALHLMANPQHALSFFAGGAGRNAVTGVLLNSIT